MLDRAGPDAAVVVDQDLRVAWVSPSVSALTGMAEATGAPDLSSMIDPGSLEGLMRAIEELGRTRDTSVPVDFVIEAPRGRVTCHGWLSDIGSLRAGHTMMRFTEVAGDLPGGSDRSFAAPERDPVHAMAGLSNLGLAVVLPGGTIAYRNSSFGDWLPGSMVQHVSDLPDVVAPACRGEARRWAEAVLDDSTCTATVCLGGDEARRWLRLDASRWESDGSGALHGVTLQDVTELVATRESMRQLLDLLPLMVFAVDDEGRLGFANRSTRELLGVGAEELEGLHLAEVLGSEAGGDLLDAVRELVETGTTVADIEDRFEDRDGIVHTLRTTLIPFLDTTTEAPTILAVSADVTSQVDNEALLSALGRNMPDLALVSRTRGERSFVSASVQYLLGWLPEEFLELPVEQTVHPEDLDRTMVLRDPLRSAPGSSHTAELRLMHRDGSWRWFEFHSVNLSNVPSISGMLMFGRDVMPRRARDEQLRYEATHDPLTALMNRAAIIAELEAALARSRVTGERVGVLFIDLDNFKLVNDALGHETGDSLLRGVAAAISEALRDSDTVGRLGGDEFLLIVRETDDAETLLRVADRVSEAVTTMTRDSSYPVTLSIGACLSVDGMTTAGAMVRDADSAMYRAKMAGKARTQLYHPTIGQHARRRLEVSQELASALDDGRFTVHFQPVFARSEDGLWRVRALEALARCPREDGSMLGPDEFIPVAEQTGLIARMGRSVAGLSFEALKRWEEKGFGVQVWLNLSMSELTQPELTDHLLTELGRSGLTPSTLGVEVTESMLGSAPELHDQVLSRLRAAGVTVLIDDFGTGYSSLGALKHRPIDIAKIDRSFTSGMIDNALDMAIAESIINIGAVMGFEVVAEGVETTSQLRELQALECGNVQGWLFSRAQPAELIDAHLGQWTRGLSDEDIAVLEAAGGGEV